MGEAPVKKFKEGGVELAVWRNGYSVLSKTWKDKKSGEFKSKEIPLFPSEYLKAAKVLLEGLLDPVEENKKEGS